MDENVKKALNNPKVTEALKGLTPEQTKKVCPGITLFDNSLLIYYLRVGRIFSTSA